MNEINEPTKGLHLRIISLKSTETSWTTSAILATASSPEYQTTTEQALIDTQYINRLILADEDRRARSTDAPAYTVMQDEPGCQSCGRPQTWTVRHPDGSAASSSYDEQAGAEEEADALNAAYDEGRKSVGLIPEWIKFNDNDPTSFPEHLSRILTWDLDLGGIYATTWYDWMRDPQRETYWQKLKHTHWMYAPTAPKDAIQPVEPAPVESPATPIETASVVLSERPDDEIDWDSIPF